MRRLQDVLGQEDLPIWTDCYGMARLCNDIFGQSPILQSGTYSRFALLFCSVFMIISCYSFRILPESSRGCGDVFPSRPLLHWDQRSHTGAGMCPSHITETQNCSQQQSTLSLFLYLCKEKHHLGLLFQILSMSSDPFASVEREQSCTLAQKPPSNAPAPTGGLDDLTGLKFIK